MPSIFKEFAKRTTLPVHIDEIRDWMIASGAVNRVVFYPLDRDPQYLRGLVRLDKWRPPESNKEQTVADIPFSTRLSPEEQRLIKAKELIHIDDPCEARTATREQVAELISEIVIPPELLVDLNKFGAGLIDHTGILAGLGALVPLAARDQLAKLYPNSLSLKRVAELCEIPDTYVPFLLSEKWGKILRKNCAK